MNPRSEPRTGTYSASAVIAAASLIVAVLALAISVSGVARAGAPKEGKGEVELLTRASGTLSTSNAGDFALQGSSFMWGQDESLVMAIRTRLIDPPGAIGCDGHVNVFMETSAGDFLALVAGDVVLTTGGLNEPTTVRGFGGDFVTAQTAVTLRAQGSDDCDRDADPDLPYLTLDLGIEVLALR